MSRTLASLVSQTLRHLLTRVRHEVGRAFTDAHGRRVPLTILGLHNAGQKLATVPN